MRLYRRQSQIACGRVPQIIHVWVILDLFLQRTVSEFSVVNSVVNSVVISVVISVVNSAVILAVNSAANPGHTLLALNLSTTTSQKCEAVPRRAHI